MQTRSRQFYVFVLLLGTLTAFGPLSIDMYLPAFPAMAEALGVPQGRIELSLASFFIGMAFGQLVYGPLTDRYGRKKPLYAGLLIYILASAACAMASSADSLIFFRLLQALGACAGIVVSRAMVRDLFDHREGAQVFSLLMLVMGVAPILAPLAGGYILLFAGWQTIFWSLAALSIVILGLIARYLPETRSPDATVRLDRVLHTYADIARHREFLGYTLTAGFAQAALFAYITGSSYVFIEYFGVPAHHFGWFFGANAFGLIAVSQINAWLLRKGHHPDHIMRRSLGLMAGFGVLLYAAALLDAPMAVLMPLLFCFLATLGAIFPNAGAGALEHQKHRAGAASALAGMMQFSLSAAAAGMVSLLHAESPLPMAGVMAACGILSCAVFVYMRRYRPQNPAATPETLPSPEA
ncbi:MAG: Bcr/CflA family multidrug efflux MFS transporter [Alphaproteobacteria bacterium]